MTLLLCLLKPKTILQTVLHTTLYTTLQTAKTSSFFIAVSLVFFTHSAHAKNIAFSFDDGLDPRKQAIAAQWNQAILDHLTDAKVQSIFFISGRNVDSKQGLTLVTDWGNNGHIIANHTYSHLNLATKKVSLKQFILDIEKNHALLNQIPNWTNRLRFPYLKQGNTVKKRDGVRLWMQQNNYDTGAVSIDASDWYYNIRYLKWLRQNPNKEPTAIKKAYLKHLLDRAIYYDDLSQQLLNRSVNHVILLHTNAINAAFLGDVIEMFNQQSWQIIDPETAYNDPLYSKQPKTLPAGESILWSQAKLNNFKGLRYPAEDSVYEKPILDKLGL
jgi:peptidoglycan-N-acetylglucosamine deacetylase